MTKKLDGGPAFPRPTLLNGDGTVHTAGSPGMSLRDWFAGMALQGMIAGKWIPKDVDPEALSMRTGSDAYANNAYVVADAMLKEREK